MSFKVEILAELEPLFEKAEKEGLWFYTNYQDLWFSPEKLRQRHKNGQYIWGKEKWKLRDPKEKLEALIEERELISIKIDAFRNGLNQ